MQPTALRELILRNPDRAFREIGLVLFPIGINLVGEEGASSPIDLLAIDPQGQAAVVIVAEQGDGEANQTMLSRGVACARRVARWSSEDLFRLLDEDEAERLGLFLEVDVDDINAARRIIVISAGFDKQTLSTAEWLREQWGLKITCLEVVIATDPETEAPYLLSTEVSGPYWPSSWQR